jgi:Rod binding domain-containing protein
MNVASLADTTLAQPDAASRHAKLTHAAQQFEALMLGELLKPLSKSSAIGEEDEDAGSNGTLQSFGVEAMAGALARSGALGFADRIVHSLERGNIRDSSENVGTDAKVLLGNADNPRGGTRR